MKERAVRDDPGGLGRGFTEPQLVECPGRNTIEEPTWDPRWSVDRATVRDSQRTVRGMLGTGCMVSPLEHTASECLPSRHEVDPRHRVPIVVIAVGEPRHQRIEICHALNVGANVCRLNWNQPQRGRRNHASQTEAATGRLEGRVAGMKRVGRPRAIDQFEIDQMITKAAVLMVVLAVHIGRNRAANRDELCPWRNRDKPSLGYHETHQVAQHHTRISTNNSQLAIKDGAL